MWSRWIIFNFEKLYFYMGSSIKIIHLLKMIVWPHECATCLARIYRQKGMWSGLNASYNLGQKNRFYSTKDYWFVVAQIYAIVWY